MTDIYEQAFKETWQHTVEILTLGLDGDTHAENLFLSSVVFAVLMIGGCLLGVVG